MCTHIPSFVYICTYIHTYVHTSIHMYIHTYIHMYIHTYIHTYVQTVPVVVCVCGKLHTVVKGHFAISHLGCLLTTVPYIDLKVSTKLMNVFYIEVVGASQLVEACGIHSSLVPA